MLRKSWIRDYNSTAILEHPDLVSISRVPSLVYKSYCFPKTLHSLSQLPSEFRISFPII